MNEFLAEMYDTRSSIGATSDNSDVEKLAEAQLLDEALQAEGVDIDQLPGETILKLAYQILGEDSHLVKAAMEHEGKHEGESDEEYKARMAKEKGNGKSDKPMSYPEKDKEAAAAAVAAGTATEEQLKIAAMQELAATEGGEETFEEKVAQADFLGRVMAHSYVSEMSDIEKKAAANGADPTKEAGRKLERTLGGSTVGGLKGMAAGGLGGAAAGGLAGALKGGKAGALKGALMGGAGGAYAGNVVGSVAGGVKGYQKSKAEEEKHPDLKKENSALNTLAEKRAMDWAAAHGLVQQEPAQQEPVQGTEEEKLASAVNARAYEMLKENGIDVDAVEAQAQATA